MGSHVLTTPARGKRPPRDTATSGRGKRGLPILADLFLVVGVALTASLLGLAIGALLSNLAFVPHAPEAVVSTTSSAAPGTIVDEATGRELIPPSAR